MQYLGNSLSTVFAKVNGLDVVVAELTRECKITLGITKGGSDSGRALEGDEDNGPAVTAELWELDLIIGGVPIKIDGNDATDSPTDSPIVGTESPTSSQFPTPSPRRPMYETLDEIMLETLRIDNQIVGAAEEASSRFNGVDVNVQNVQAKVDGVETKVDGMGTTINNIDTRVDGMGTTIGNIDTTVGSMGTTIVNIDTTVGAMGTTIGSKIDTTVNEMVGNVLIPMKSTVTNMTDTISNKIETTVASVEGKVDGVETKVNGVETKVDVIVEQYLPEMGTTIGNIDATVGSMGNTIDNIDTTVGAMGTTIGSKIDTTVGSMGTTIGNKIDTTVNEMVDNVLIPMKSTVDNMTDTIGNNTVNGMVDNVLIPMKSTVTNMTDTISNKIETAVASVGTSANNTESIVKEIKMQVDGMKDQVNEMHQVNALIHEMLNRTLSPTVSPSKSPTLPPVVTSSSSKRPTDKPTPEAGWYVDWVSIS